MKAEVVQVHEEETNRLYEKAKNWSQRQTTEFYVIEEIDATAVVTEDVLKDWLKTLKEEELNYFSVHIFELNTFYGSNCMPEPLDHKSMWIRSKGMSDE